MGREPARECGAVDGEAPGERGVILHIDLDAFFASVEERLIPSIRGKPIAVGSGCIASCSYAARRYGLRAGMPLRKARRLCPDLIVLEGHYQVYRCFTDRVWEISGRYSCGTETFLDEAYCDLTGLGAVLGHPESIGARMKEEIRTSTGLSTTVGIGSNRMIAKMASKSAKPDGLRYVAPGDEDAFIRDRPVRDLPGVGPKTARELADMNIRTIEDLRRVPLDILRAIFGALGDVFHERCRGRDTRVVNEREMPRSISRETTLHRESADPGELEGMLDYLAERAMRMMRRLGLRTRTVKVHVRYEDWRSDAQGRTLPGPTAIDQDVTTAARQILHHIWKRRVKLRHLGVVLSSFVLDGPVQMDLFRRADEAQALHLNRAVDRIRDKFGHSAIVAGRSCALIGHLRQDSYGFVLRTPSLTR